MRLYVALGALSLIWGLSFVFIKWLVEPAGLWGTVFIRCTAGAVVVLPLLWKNRREFIRRVPYQDLLVVGVFNAGLPWGLIALSETQINSTTAAVLNALTPICTAFIGFLFFSIKLKPQQWGGVVLGFLGILVLMNFEAGELLKENFIGMGTMILAAICYGFSSQYTKKNLQETGVLLIAACTLTVGAIVGLIGMGVTGSFKAFVHVPFLDPKVLIAIIGLGCFGSGIAHLLFYYLVTRGSAEFATSVTYLIPITAMIWGFILLHEQLTSRLALGLVIIFTGVYLAGRKSVRFRTAIKSKKAG
ncbi:EamA family transporter [Halobacillus salinarum]|uniref:EamA family transporter n=1 Tax=Halobacillus salinarum TaxID=2932257 RepID=A0ABY4EHJ6_9BACI|nr:EamA family transporter [Halobacillus salinarum]UOQ43905.1 EamA family transporter [Halobacillus salinarum]